jgi:starch phosphorylase
MHTNGPAAAQFSRALPEPLAPLDELSLDLRWTWSHASDRLWEMLDQEAWERTANPWLILQSVPRRRLEELAADPRFTEELQRLAVARRQYLESPTWCSRNLPQLQGCSVAYFSMEYGLSEALPIYSGGLGVLAGDHLKTASDLGVPVIGVGLLYQQGYFRQVVDADGRQIELYPQNVPTDLPVTPVLARDGTRLAILVELPGRMLRLRVWLAGVGRVPLYLLDSNDPLNSPSDRGITAQLYVDDHECRLLQQIVLGIGGWRTLRALGIVAQVCHLNEGHASFVTLERARAFRNDHAVSFAEALWATRPGNVFTTHTPVAAAFDTYPAALLRRYGMNYARSLGVEPEQLLGLGRRDPLNSEEPFNMALLAARTCGRINGVSALHGAVSRQILQPLFPRWPESELPVSHITNGVHVPSFDSAAADELWTNACGADRWREPSPKLQQRISSVPDESLWAMRSTERHTLIRYARRRLATQVAQRGASPEQIARAAATLDPDALTLGFARRFTAYKRPHLLLADEERLARLLANESRPVQIVVAGKAHPSDRRGKEMIRDWVRFVARPDVRGRAVFIEDYDLALAAMLVQGIDVWINTPLRPWEASGTSGMKVLVNGGLNLSTRDGWWAEAWEPDVGWALGGGEPQADPEAPLRRREVEQLYELLERQIVPEFYERDAAGIPRRWVTRVRASMSRLTERFSSSRMLLQYVHEAYLPAALEQERRAADGARIAIALAAWAERLSAHWHEIQLGALAAAASPGQIEFKVLVRLGAVSPEDVAVQLYAEPGGSEPGVCRDMMRAEESAAATTGDLYTLTLATRRPPTHFTARVVPRSQSARIPLELPWICWGTPS